MRNKINTSRITALVVVMAIVLVIYASTLYDLQIKNGSRYYASTSSAIVYTDTVEAARGNIYDRNGKLLVYSKTVYNIVFNRKVLMKNEDPNGVILKLCELVKEKGYDYVDTFPVTTMSPFAYVVNMTDTQRYRLNKYFRYFDMDEDITAADLVSWMREHYGIDFTVNVADARTMIGIRYEMECCLIGASESYSFIEDADASIISLIEESGIPGVEVQTTSRREYNTPYAAHILGYIGKQSEEQYEANKDKEGYGYDTDVGKDGVEALFEEYLHGVDGSITLTKDIDGNVTGIVSETAAKSGDDVYLTLDIDLTRVAAESLASTIEEINSKREDSEQAGGGAVVVKDVNSGEVLVSESYPSYDLTTIKTEYSNLLSDPENPLFNRATQGAYNPGSTFKMVTAYAGLKSGAITQYSTVTCTGRFTKYADKDYAPACWVYPGTHDTLNVVGAIENSCNVFFYWLGDKIGIDEIEKTVKLFGLGQKTGFELTESEGTIASREYKKNVLNDGWWAADNLITAIGQGLNKFTPLQISNYISAIANDGTLYKTTILKCIKDSASGETIYQKNKEVLSVIEDDEEILPILRSGMRAVATTGTARGLFVDFPIKVAAKTGTVQSDTSSQNSGVFVCYAPYDNPQIEITVVVEGGGSGAALGGVAKAILTEYFTNYSLQSEVDEEYTPLR